MTYNFNQILFALSSGLDTVEHELVGVTTYHAKRVAYITAIIGKAMGLPDEVLVDLTACAVLHDNALTEFISEEHGQAAITAKNLGKHCVMGESNVKNLALCSEVRHAILYHHENADGSGPFLKTAPETPLPAQIIHFADILDVECDLGDFDSNKLAQIHSFINNSCGTLFAKDICTTFKHSFTQQDLYELQNLGVDFLLKHRIPQREVQSNTTLMRDLAKLFAKIIDYKSHFTCKHSIGIAEKALQMAQFYHYDEETQDKLYLAGALHDIGKLVINNEVLEKTGKLSAKEYEYIQGHALASHTILSQISGFEDICAWASHHHEKLDGTGYPFGLRAENLSAQERLMAVLDIYQALVEPRPYKDGFPHQVAIAMLEELVRKGQLDGNIVQHINLVFLEKNDFIFL